MRTLDADSLEELVVKSIQGHIIVISFLGILFLIIEHFLSLVCHKAPSTDPKQARVDRQQAVAHVITLKWRLYYLQRSVAPNIPDDDFICVVHREHKRLFLDYVKGYDWALVGLKSTQVSISV